VIRFIFSLLLVFFVLQTPDSYAVSKEDVLKKYERIIVRSNQMNISGYDLRGVTYKLKRVTEILVQNHFDEADQLLGEITKDFDGIEAQGPEQLQREQKLIWLEIFGDFIQQISIYILIVLILIRFGFLKASMLKRVSSWDAMWKLALTMTIAAIASASIGLIRYGQSSWSFVDLQVALVGISGLLGGARVGAITGIVNGLFRLVVVPGASVYFVIPIAVGLAGGIVRNLRPNKPLQKFDPLIGGMLISLVHSLFMYIPIFPYIPLISFVAAVACLTVIEGALVSLFFALAWQRFREQKRKETEKELMRTRLAFLQAQINPHFLFNTLNTIAAVCGEEGADRARKLIIQLSTFFRRITKQESDFVSLKDELEYIEAYLNIEQARFGKRLTIEKDIHLTSRGYHAMVPVLALQPIVENAVKHGLSKKTEGGKIIIGAHEEGSTVVIEIKDTGVGMNEQQRNRLFKTRQTDESEDKDHTGIGLSNIRERLNRCYQDKFKMSLQSEPNKGTTITLSLPKAA
jgi:LytS/YehU family sensor histidine kinase